MSALPIAQLRDTSTFPPGGSFDQTSRVITGARVVLEWIVRAWFTPAGSLYWAPDRGFDLASLDNADLTLNDLYRIKARLEREATAIEYVSGASVTLTLAAGVLTVEATIVLVDGRSYPLAVRIGGAAAALVNFYRLPVAA